MDLYREDSQLYLRVLILMLHAPFGTDCFPLRLCQCLEREMSLLQTKPYKNALNLDSSDCPNPPRIFLCPICTVPQCSGGGEPFDGALHLDIFPEFHLCSCHYKPRCLVPYPLCGCCLKSQRCAYVVVHLFL